MAAAAQRRTVAIGIAASAPPGVLLWYGLRNYLPPIAGMEQPLARLQFALGCIGVAVLLTLLPGIEAVAHERLVTPAIDPLAGAENKRMKINLRYLQNTLEQLVVFAAGLVLLAWYSAGGGSMRAVVAVTAVWIAARWAFWIGYHRSPLLRGWGAMGMAQNIVVLLYGVYRFGYDFAGPAGGVAPIFLFGAIEGYLFLAASRPSPR